MSVRKTNSPVIEKLKLRDKDRITISCDNCGNDIPAQNFNINSSLAKCDSCDTLFTLKDDSFFNNDRVGRPEMIMPEGTDVLTLHDSLDIRLDWLKSNPRSSLGFLTFFTVMWNGFLAIMASNFIAAGAVGNIAFLGIHLAVGLGLLYYILSIYLNYTDIIVTRDYIEIGQRPIKNPFKPTKTIPTRDIKQLYVTKYVSSTSNNVANYAYALYADLGSNQRSIKLIDGMNKETQLYLEQEIERFLKIKDDARPKTIQS